MTQRVYDTTAKSLATLYYWRLHGTEVHEQQFHHVVRDNMFKPKSSRVARRVTALAARDMIRVEDGKVYLTGKGLWYVEQKQKTIQAIMYGHVLKFGTVPRVQLEGMYDTFSYRITHDAQAPNRTTLILKRLRREGGLDYTDDEVWATKETELRKEE